MSFLYSLVLAGLVLNNVGGLSLEKRSLGAKPDAPIVTKNTILDETERFEQSYPLNPNGKVRVSNINGSITVEAWDKPEVKLEAVKIGDSQESLAEVEIKVDAQQNSFSVEADYLNRRQNGEKGWKNYRKLEVQFHLMVPRTAVLDEVETVNGSVTVSNFVNTTRISAVNGNVKATNLRGNASLSTVNGTVSADFDVLESTGKISLETVNGQVNLLIPSDSNATIKADTLNGKIVNDFGLPVRKGEYVGKDLHGRLGNGDTQIKLSSVNGGLLINHKNDGKNLSQPTNLLNDKGRSNNEDWDNDKDNARNIKIDKEKMNREIARAIDESNKEIAESQKQIAESQKEVREAMKELKNISPEIAEVTNEAVRISLEGLKNIKPADFEKLARIADINWSSAAPRIEKKTETFAVKGTPKVSIDAKNCDVSVRGWDRSEVQYVVKKFSRNREQNTIQTKVENTDSKVNITVVNGDNETFFDDSNEVRIEVFVPKKSDLKIVSTGEIRLENVSGELDLNGTDEAINVRDSSGKLRVSSVDGRVRVLGFQGEINTKTTDGEVYLEGNFSAISANAGDGNIYLTLLENTGATFVSNSDVSFADNKNSSELKLVKESENTWRIGNGNAKYNFDFGDGRLFIRNANSIASN